MLIFVLHQPLGCGCACVLLPPLSPPSLGEATYVLRVASLAVHSRLGLLRGVRVWAVLVRCPSDGLGLRG